MLQVLMLIIAWSMFSGTVLDVCKFNYPRSNFPCRMEGVDPLTNGLYTVIL